MKFYLGYDSRENALCCPKHAPLEKIKRTSKVMWMFFFINSLFLAAHTAFFTILYIFFKDHYAKHKKNFKYGTVWEALLGGTFCFFMLSVYYFCSVNIKNPGRSQGIDKNMFYIYLDRAIKQKRNLDYFCFFCRTIWSSSGVHCMTCGTCIEGFDHHCTFVDNCIGYKNHAKFLNFLGCAFFYTLLLSTNTVWVYYMNTWLCNKLDHPDYIMICDEGIYQVLIQCGCGLLLFFTIL